VVFYIDRRMDLSAIGCIQMLHFDTTCIVAVHVQVVCAVCMLLLPCMVTKHKLPTNEKLSASGPIQM